jgi:uncharacterized membrane protein
MLASIFVSFRGLPTHILVVHAVVVLVPLCFIGVIVSAFSKAWRQKLAVPILVLLVVSFLASLLAVKTGKSFRHRIGSSPAINHHAHIAVWVIAFVAVALVLTAVWLIGEDRAGTISLRSETAGTVVPSGRAPSPRVRLVACALAIISCAAASGWIAYVGEAGSKATYGPVMQATQNK